MAKYKVTKRFGKFSPGMIVDDSDRYIRRKIQEGGCTEPVNKSEKKMDSKKIENKMIPGSSENKKGGIK